MKTVKDKMVYHNVRDLSREADRMIDADETPHEFRGLAFTVNRGRSPTREMTRSLLMMYLGGMEHEKRKQDRNNDN